MKRPWLYSAAAQKKELNEFKEKLCSTSTFDIFNKPIRWKDGLAVHQSAMSVGNLQKPPEKRRRKNLRIWKCFLVLEADEIRYHLIASFISAALIPLLQQWCFIPLITHNTLNTDLLTHTHTGTHTHTHNTYTHKDVLSAAVAEKVLSVPHAPFFEAN